MCGFVGIWRFDGQAVDVSALARATNTLRFRGPDDEGYYLCSVQNGDWCHCGGADSDPRLNLTPLSQFAGKRYQFGLGFRRLSILDLSPAGHQPMSSGDGRFWIAYNGEVYNYVELRQELEAEGYRFFSQTDTEVVLAAYRRWGERCVERLNGMWAFAIWDSKEQTLFLSRDRFGIKPLYYFWVEGTELIFASEIKAVLAARGTWMSPSPLRVAAYLALGKQPRESHGETFFDQIQALPPSNCLMVRGGRLQRLCYWTIPTPAKTTASSDQLIERYKSLLTDAVRRHLRSDVPVGSCLSGGLDSTAITLLMNRLLSDGKENGKPLALSQKTFSAVYPFPGPWDEQKFINAFLKGVTVDSHFAYPDHERLLHDFEELIWYQEQPFQSLSIFSQWCVMSEAHSQGTKVLLDGVGADAVLAGNNPFPDAIQSSLISGKWPHALRLGMSLCPGNYLAVGRIVLNAVHGAISYWVRKALGCEPVPRKRTILRWAQGACLAKEMTDLLLRKREEFAYSYPRSLHEILQNWVNGGLLILLRYLDRNSMRWSVGARLPFLDQTLVDFLFGLDHGLWLRDGWTKWIHRQALRDSLPAEIVWRRDKVGFEAPDQMLMRPNIGLFESFLRNDALRQYADDKSVDRIYSILNSESPSKKDVRLAWRMINLAAWLEIMPRQTENTKLLPMFAS